MTGYLLSFTVQISVLILGSLVATAALRRRSAALRHWVLSVAIVCAACMPVLQVFVPDWALDTGRRSATPQKLASSAPGTNADQASSDGAKPGTRSPARVAAQGRTWSVWVVYLLPRIWAFGAITGFALLGAGLARLAWLAQRARPLSHPTWVRLAAEMSLELGVHRPVELLQTDRPAILVAWGWLRPRIMVPRAATEWPAEDVGIVIRHELAHLRRRDWNVQLVGEVLRALNWFNPLIWMASQRLRSESERACDDAVLASGVGGPYYAERLVALACALNAHRRWTPTCAAPAMARPSSLERRVAAMLNSRLSRAPLTTATRAAIVCLALAVALPVAGLAVFAQAPASFAGSVLDPSSRLVPNATVVLINMLTQATHEVVSDGAGRFTFAGLPAGDYALEARLPGFATLKGTVAVTAGGLQRDLKLQLGSIQETIVVLVTTAPSAQPTGTPPPPATPATASRPRQAEPCSVAAATGGNIRPPVKVRDAKPLYPEHLKVDRVAGPVIVEGVLGKDGTVRGLRVLESPHPDLGWAVMEAVGRWVFMETLLNCEPVEVKLKAVVRFEY